MLEGGLKAAALGFPKLQLPSVIKVLDFTTRALGANTTDFLRTHNKFPSPCSCQSCLHHSWDQNLSITSDKNQSTLNRVHFLNRVTNALYCPAWCLVSISEASHFAKANSRNFKLTNRSFLDSILLSQGKSTSSLACIPLLHQSPVIYWN